MNRIEPPRDAVVLMAAEELAQIQRQIREAREMLGGLQRDLREATSRLASCEAAQLVEANEQLVFAALRAQDEAETAGRALHEASRSAGLDGLTQLPNRVLLVDRFTHAIANARRSNTRLALMFLDLDHFKQINDAFGHAVGDDVLTRAAQCLALAVRAVDTVSRHGGDEFLILLSDVSQASDAAAVAHKVLAALGMPNRFGEHALRLSASIGISIWPDDAEDSETLIALADAAMYTAKRRGPGNVAFHTQDAYGAAPRLAPLVSRW